MPSPCRPCRCCATPADTGGEVSVKVSSSYKDAAVQISSYDDAAGQTFEAPFSDIAQQRASIDESDVMDSEVAVEVPRERFTHGNRVARPPVPSTESPIPRASISGSFNLRIDEAIDRSSCMFVTVRPVTLALKRSRSVQVGFVFLALLSLYSLVEKVLLLMDAQFYFSEIIAVVGGFLKAAGFIMAVVLARRGFPRQGIRSAVFALAADIPSKIIDGILAYQGANTVVVIDKFAWAFMYLSFAVLLAAREREWRPVWLMNSFLFILVAGVAFFVGGVLYFLNIVLGVFFFSFPAYMSACRIFALRRARLEMQPEKDKYDRAWRRFTSEQMDELQALSEVVRAHGGNKVLQSSSSLSVLMWQAAGINDWYQEVVSGWAQQLNVEYHAAPVKRRARAEDKITRSYSGRPERVLDFIRSTIIVDSINEVHRVLCLVLAETRVHIIKNRFEPTYDGSGTFGLHNGSQYVSRESQI